MKSQEHNQGELGELKVNIEADVITCIKKMADNSGYTIDDLVVIALKRFCASHSDYQKIEDS